MADLHISKQTIYDLFSGIKNKKFLIPDYQRPYQWDVEKCEMLWNDIEQFSDTKPEEDDFYFLGTIVSYENQDKNQEIIDGQQRITSFMLLLRAFYKKLQDAKADNQIDGLKRQLEPCLWSVNKISGDVDDYRDIKVHSLVIDDDERVNFHSIIETGKLILGANDNYSKNYEFFKYKCDEYAMKNPTRWKELYITILHHCIILPIKCESQDTALTIFSTLNDRGLPLSDSDIFKAKLYALQGDDENKLEFINLWKDISYICKKSKVSIDELFRYYSHIIRARNADTSKEIGLRKFYSQNNYRNLYSSGLLSDIKLLALFWEHVNSGNEVRDDFDIKLSIESRKYLSCLKYYTNEYWKYVISVFFICNKNDEFFDEKFQVFLKKIISYFFIKYFEYPSVNAIKDDVYNFCAFIVDRNNGSDLVGKVMRIDEKLINSFDGAKKLTRAVLLLNAYLTEGQDDFINESFEIEHIFPRKWQNTNYNGWSVEDADSYLEKIGNKIIFEKKLNVQAGNNYFNRKKVEYSKSKIKEVLNLSQYNSSDWVKEDIENRDKVIREKLIAFFQSNLF